MCLGGIKGTLCYVILGAIFLQSFTKQALLMVSLAQYPTTLSFFL